MVRKRQAVVLIHGIGEQRPMDTLRSFVSGLGFKTYHSRPDRLSVGTAPLHHTGDNETASD